jgi:hypothetical protein
MAVAIGGGVTTHKRVHSAMLPPDDPVPTGGTIDDVVCRPLRSFASDKEINGEREICERGRHMTTGGPSGEIYDTRTGAQRSAEKHVCQPGKRLSRM